MSKIRSSICQKKKKTNKVSACTNLQSFKSLNWNLSTTLETCFKVETFSKYNSSLNNPQYSLWSRRSVVPAHCKNFIVCVKFKKIFFKDVFKSAWKEHGSNIFSAKRHFIQKGSPDRLPVEADARNYYAAQ